MTDTEERHWPSKIVYSKTMVYVFLFSSLLVLENIYQVSLQNMLLLATDFDSPHFHAACDTLQTPSPFLSPIKHLPPRTTHSLCYSSTWGRCPSSLGSQAILHKFPAHLESQCQSLGPPASPKPLESLQHGLCDITPRFMSCFISSTEEIWLNFSLSYIFEVFISIYKHLYTFRSRYLNIDIYSYRCLCVPVDVYRRRHHLQASERWAVGRWDRWPPATPALLAWSTSVMKINCAPHGPELRSTDASAYPGTLIPDKTNIYVK